MPYTAVLGILLCLMLMFSLPSENWVRLFVWLGIGFAIYFGYGRYNSTLAKERAQAASASRAPRAPSPAQQA
jgi:APA family basic amino acid/polyamine antiporter